MNEHKQRSGMAPTTMLRSDTPFTMEKASAVVVALNTAEVLEQILIELEDQTTLLLAQRVSRFWNNVIATSTILQQDLYFKMRPSRVPASDDEACDPEIAEQQASGKRAEWKMNPVLVNSFGRWFQLNPLYLFQFEENSCNGCHNRSFASADPERRKAFVRAGASWRRMLVCQPPSMALGVHDIAEGNISSYGKIFCPNGLTMGTYYDYTFQRLLAHRGPAYPTYRTYWLPPGHEDIWPYFNQTKYAEFIEGYGETVFLLFTSEHQDLRHLNKASPSTPSLSFRCDEHEDHEINMENRGYGI